MEGGRAGGGRGGEEREERCGVERVKTELWVLMTGWTLATLYTALLLPLYCIIQPRLELEVNGQDGATGEVGREGGSGGMVERGEEGQLGERGLVEVKNSWTLWCWRTWQGRAVRHLGSSSMD